MTTMEQKELRVLLIAEKYLSGALFEACISWAFDELADPDLDKETFTEAVIKLSINELEDHLQSIRLDQVEDSLNLMTIINAHELCQGINKGSITVPQLTAFLE